MKLNQGKIGRQEIVCAVAITACASGIFTPGSQTLYANGNPAYISMLLSAGLALCVFGLLVRAMRRTGAHTLWELLRFGLGSVAGRIAATFYTLLFILSAASLLSRFTLLLGQFVFPLTPGWNILIYLLAAACVPAWLGLEGLGRAARLLGWPMLFSLTLALILAAGNYEPYRLAPFPGDSMPGLAGFGARGTLFFLPALLGLLVVAKGAHGLSNAGKAGYIANAVSGVLAAVCRLCLGMSYSYKDLAQMHSPMYRLATGFKAEGYFSRLDVLLVFGWAMGGMLAAAFYIYAASYLYTNAFGQEDIRPSVAVFSGVAGAAALAPHLQFAPPEAVMAFLSAYGYILMVAPLLMAAMIARAHVKRRRRARGGAV
ncbi:MAG: spore germination protein [Clostridiales bacterium]|jgi:lysylphosphatidylglycerol synthetase-like protein (DUF2156 family)|nr:spore germination protein [Clostridiales bacterium]